MGNLCGHPQADAVVKRSLPYQTSPGPSPEAAEKGGSPQLGDVQKPKSSPPKGEFDSLAKALPAQPAQPAQPPPQQPPQQQPPAKRLWVTCFSFLVSPATLASPHAPPALRSSKLRTDCGVRDAYRLGKTLGTGGEVSYLLFSHTHTHTHTQHTHNTTTTTHRLLSGEAGPG